MLISTNETNIHQMLIKIMIKILKNILVLYFFQFAIISCTRDKNDNPDNSKDLYSTFDISKSFEIAASVYPWELHDEGTVNVLNNLQSISAVNSVYLVGLMHPEPRPHGDNSAPKYSNLGRCPLRNHWH